MSLSRIFAIPDHILELMQGDDEGDSDNDN